MIRIKEGSKDFGKLRVHWFTMWLLGWDVLPKWYAVDLGFISLAWRRGH